MNTLKLTHAGAVVFRKNSDQILYLVISSSDGENWVLPKGHIECDERTEDAALREVKEEAGIIGELVAGLSVDHYKKGDEHVNIRYFLIKKVGEVKTTENRIIKWLDEKSAIQLLTFPEAKNALRSAVKVLRVI